jgi:hypothetical protein
MGKILMFISCNNFLFCWKEEEKIGLQGMKQKN